MVEAPLEALSREISVLDLKAALTAAQNQPKHELGSTSEELLNHQSDNKNQNAESQSAEVEETSESDPLGLKTPPYHVTPNPPPPTPATPEKASCPTQDIIECLGNEEVAVPPPTSQIGVEGGLAKKKKKKSSGKNKKSAATGFEEFYADSPITPAEHEEESDIYAPDRPFPERIQTCIQRYRARRKLDEVRSNILTKYLVLGGVEATLKTFSGGLDKDTIENSTAQEIAAIQASDFVRTVTNKHSKYYDGSDDWVVDFEGVAKGFFSYRIPRMFPIDSKKDLQLYSAVIRNFLNYVLQHAVCPEYTIDVMAARRICDLAEKELWAITQLHQKLPGDFNIATSMLYGGRYQDIFIGDFTWATEDLGFEEVSINNRYTKAEAERIFKTAIAFAGNDKLFHEVLKADIHIVNTERKCYEVTGYQRPDPDTVYEYANVKEHNSEESSMKALGVLKLKAWEGPCYEPEDLSDDENEKCLSEVEEFFWLEDEILEHFLVGMKLEIIVHELNVGIKFFDSVISVYCSFHCKLPNEKMIGWKEPVPNMRLAPTEDDPDIEERAITAAMEEELNKTEKEFYA